MFESGQDKRPKRGLLSAHVHGSSVCELFFVAELGRNGVAPRRGRAVLAHDRLLAAVAEGSGAGLFGGR